MNSTPHEDNLCVNTLRALAMDAVQAANSGHPGLPMGAAPMATALWTRHLKHNPRNPKWFDRDRFVLSAGHGSMLLYGLLHLTKYDVSLDDIKAFRQWGSITPGHPENTHTPGVEMATGPLGQGISSAVGMAIAEKYLAATFNRPELQIVDHYTYVLASDGDLMEGISNEAASLAGHLGLGKLIVLYDDNHITIDGPTSIAFTENVGQRFEALGWHVQHVDGMILDAVDDAIKLAQVEEGRPSIICCRTIIGFGSPNKAGTSKCHGSPLGVEEVKLAKEALGIPLEPAFWIADEARTIFGRAVEAGAQAESNWHAKFNLYQEQYPEDADAFTQALTGEVDETIWQSLPTFPDKVSTRAASGKVIQALSPFLPTLVGGSADLAESNNTHIPDTRSFQPTSPDGRILEFGVREHAMAAAVNGINLHGGIRAFGATFLIFSDYCRGSLRLAALMECPSIFVFTHDSIGLGEDGPTHQPIEHLAALRAIPNMNVMRPADGNETAACWRVALETFRTPCALVLTRQALRSISTDHVEDHPARFGAYAIHEPSAQIPDAIVVATGSEVAVALDGAKMLESEGISVRVVSMPSWFLFERQAEGYRKQVLPDKVPTLSIEAASTFGWSRYAQAHIGIDRFGASAPGDLLMREFGFTAENVVRSVRNMLGHSQR